MASLSPNCIATIVGYSLGAAVAVRDVAGAIRGRQTAGARAIAKLILIAPPTEIRLVDPSAWVAESVAPVIARLVIGQGPRETNVRAWSDEFAGLLSLVTGAGIPVDVLYWIDEGMFDYSDFAEENRAKPGSRFGACGANFLHVRAPELVALQSALYRHFDYVTSESVRASLQQVLS